MTTIESLTAQSASSQKATTQLNQDFDDFLRLLTTQLKNQDPLDPADATEFTNQLVQFSQVEQQLKTNDTLEDLRALDALRITDLGLGFVGMDVIRAGDSFQFDGSSEVDMTYALPQAARESTVAIKNADGETVYSIDGETAAGTNSFTWNGRNEDGFTVAPGTYTIEVSAQDSEGKSLNVQTNVPGRVRGIESDGTGNVLLLIGKEQVPITDVTRATLPNETIPATGGGTDNSAEEA